MKLTEHFNKNEFDSHDGAAMPTSVLENVKKVAQNLEKVRAFVGHKSITVSSGYRSPSHNTHVGGATHSQHLYGKASDIKIAGMQPPEVAVAILTLIAEGEIPQGGVGLYNTFVHYDIRGKKARWNKNSHYNLSQLESEVMKKVKKKHL